MQFLFLIDAFLLHDTADKKKVVNYKKISPKFKRMSSICEAISELHKSGKNPVRFF